jgi:hypothetical protein
MASRLLPRFQPGLAPELQVCAEILLKLPLQTPGLAVGWAELEDEDEGGAAEDEGGAAEDVVAGREVVVGGGGGAEVVVRRVVAAEEVEDGAAVVGAWPGMHWKNPDRGMSGALFRHKRRLLTGVLLEAVESGRATGRAAVVDATA